MLLPPAAWEIQLLYEEMNLVLQEAFADTCSLDYLIRRAKERMIEYKEGTNAIVKGAFTPTDLDVTGCRFLVLDSDLSYIAIEKIEDGIYKLECEIAGTEGNLSAGQLLPDDGEELEGLETAEIIECIEMGNDDEDVEAFRERYYDNVSGQDFGGNEADYKNKINSLQNVGGCKIVPVWQGGGTVKVVIVNSQHETPSESVISEVQTILDPVTNSGEGKGIAPIGHRVTVVGAESILIDITMSVTYTEGYDYETARESISKALEDYYSELRSDWGNDNAEIGTIVRVSQIETRLLNLTEILDVEDTVMNGSTKNISLQYDQIPVRGLFNGA